MGRRGWIVTCEAQKGVIGRGYETPPMSAEPIDNERSSTHNVLFSLRSSLPPLPF